MQNIDPVFMLQPAVVIVGCTLLLAYWHRRRGFGPVVLAYSFVAYAVAIAMKYAVQLPTIDAVTGDRLLWTTEHRARSILRAPDRVL